MSRVRAGDAAAAAGRAVITTRRRSAPGLAMRTRPWWESAACCWAAAARDLVARLEKHAAEVGRSRAAQLEPERDVGRASGRRRLPTIWRPAANTRVAGGSRRKLKGRNCSGGRRARGEAQSRSSSRSSRSARSPAASRRCSMRWRDGTCFARTWSAARPPRGARFPGRPAIASCSSIRRDSPRCAANRERPTRPTAAKNADLVLFVVDGPLKS